MTKQPLCRSCGKPIAKNTHRVWLDTKGEYGNTKVDALPRTVKDCRKLANGEILHIWRNTPERGGGIYSFSWWDGETYKDQFFCTQQCAVKLAYACARGGQVLPAYNEANAKEEA